MHLLLFPDTSPSLYLYKHKEDFRFILQSLMRLLHTPTSLFTTVNKTKRVLDFIDFILNQETQT